MEASVEALYEDLLTKASVRGQATHENLLYFRPRYMETLAAIKRHLPRRQSVADLGTHDLLFLRLAREIGFQRLVAFDAFPLPQDETFAAGLSDVSLVTANFNQDRCLGDVPDQSFDCVVSMEVLEHLLYHPFGYLQEAWRVLAPGGLLVLTTPNPSTLASAYRTLRGETTTWGDMSFAMEPKSPHGEGGYAVWDIHFREYTPNHVGEMIARLDGSSVLERGFIAGDAEALAGSKRLALSAVSRFGLDRSRLFAKSQYWVVRRDR